MIIERFIIKETKNGNSTGYLESNHDVKVSSCVEPLLVGARMLLGTGMSPKALLTSKWQGKEYDNFVPQTIGELAKLSTSETDLMGLRFVEWVPYPDEGVEYDEK